MLDDLRARYHALWRRARRLERRELDALTRWLEHTRNLLHLSVLVFVPLLIGAVTWLSNVAPFVSFLLFPPLASGTFTLFADPESRYSTPSRFVGGMTAGACCGWIAFAATPADLVGGPVIASAAALSVFLTGVVTWALDLEEPTAFSTALLVLITGSAQFAYVIGVALSSTFVAAAFVLWRDRFYERRARYLYQTTKGDDHVLVPMGEGDETTARFAAEIAGAHEAGKVVLFDVVEAEAAAERAAETDGETTVRTVPPSDSDASVDSDERRPSAGPGEDGAIERAAGDAARRLDALAVRLEREADVPCEVVVAADGRRSADLVLRTARRNNCDLVVVPYEEHPRGGLSRYVKRLFDGEIDVIAFRSRTEHRRWNRGLVAVRRVGDTAHAMIDFAQRVVGEGDSVSVCTCIDRESERRTAEHTLATLVDAFPGRFETRIATTPVEEYLESVAPAYDVVFVGSSTDRSGASRFLSPPTFERLRDLETDVAIVHRGRAP